MSAFLPRMHGIRHPLFHRWRGRPCRTGRGGSKAGLLAHGEDRAPLRSHHHERLRLGPKAQHRQVLHRIGARGRTSAAAAGSLATSPRDLSVCPLVSVCMKAGGEPAGRTPALFAGALRPMRMPGPTPSRFPIRLQTPCSSLGRLLAAAWATPGTTGNAAGADPHDHGPARQVGGVLTSIACHVHSMPIVDPSAARLSLCGCM